MKGRKVRSKEVDDSGRLGRWGLKEVKGKDIWGKYFLGF